MKQRSKLIVWACLAVLPLRAEHRKVKPFEEWQRGGLHEITMVGSGYANPQTLRRYYETHFLQQHRFPDLLLIKAHATSEDYDWDHANVTNPLERGEAFEKQLYMKARRRPSQTVSEILAMGPNAVLRSVAEGQISRLVLNGSDPTLFDSGLVHCELLQISFHASLISPLNVQFFLKTDPLPTQEQAQTITCEMQSKVRYREIETFMQTGVWFIGYGGFPLWYPFSHDTHPPTREESWKQNRIWLLGSSHEAYVSAGMTDPCPAVNTRLAPFERQ